MKSVCKPLVSVLFVLVIAAPHETQAETVIQSVAGDQTAVYLTIYKNNQALVKEVRKINIPQGEGELKFMDIPSMILPETVRVTLLNDAEKFTVLEQDQEGAPLSAPGSAMNLAFDQQKPAGPVREQRRSTLVNPAAAQKAPTAKPCLVWRYKNESKDAHELEVSYFTFRLGWKADYAFTFDEEKMAGDFSNWVTIDNHSGVDYRNVGLKIVAGEINRSNPVDWKDEYKCRQMIIQVPTSRGKNDVNEASINDAPFSEYDLGRKITVIDGKTKQVRLLEAHGIKVQKEFLINGAREHSTQEYREKVSGEPVSVYIVFANTEANHLGSQLPEGTVRVYDRDDNGVVRFIGEDKIEHVSKDKDVRVKTGQAKDVTVERVQTDYKAINSLLYELEWMITVKNKKNQDVKAVLVEPFSYGNWKIMESNHPYTKADESTAKFEVMVPKNSEVKVSYRMKMGRDGI